jgi:hypothetical protein
MTPAQLAIAKAVIEAVLPPIVDGITWVAIHVHHEKAALAIRRLINDAAEDSEWLCSNLVERVPCDRKKKGWRRRVNLSNAARVGSPQLIEEWLSTFQQDDKVLLIELEEAEEEEETEEPDADLE